MAENVLPTHETILQLIADSAPENWSPRVFVENTGTDRRALDAVLDDLRGADLVRLTAWQTGRGQGYEITPLGGEILADPELRAGFRDAARLGSIPRAEPAPEGDETYTTDDTRRARLHVLQVGFTPGPALLTRLIVIACLVVFGIGAMVASQNGRSMFRYLLGADATTTKAMGALTPGYLLDGEWWRLISASFVHFGILHLLFNLHTLRVVGRSLERMYGRWRYPLLFLLSGLTGAVMNFVWSPVAEGGPKIASGASACVWGLIGSQYATLVLNRDLFPDALYRKQLRGLNWLILLNLLLGLLPNISMVSHIAGGIGGVLLTIAMHHQRWSDFSRKFFAVIVLVAWPIFLLTLLGSVMQTDPRWQKIRERAAVVNRVQNLKDLRESIVPKISALEADIEKLDLDRQKGIDAKADAPAPDRYAEVRGRIESAAEGIKEPSLDPQAEEIRISARRYLGLLKGEVDYLAVLGVGGQAATDEQMRELRKIRRELKAAKEDWDKVRQVR